jgi:hypothetical protein
MAEKALVSETILRRDWGYLFLFYLILNATRFVGVFLFFPTLARGPYGINWRQAVLLSYGGLRGAVSLTLALVVSQEEGIPEETRALILFFTAGIVLLTILINGSTCKLVLQKLKLNNPTRVEQELYIRAMNLIENELEVFAGKLKNDKYLGSADWNVVYRYLPVFSPQIYWHRVREGHLCLDEAEIALVGRYVRENESQERKGKEEGGGFSDEEWGAGHGRVEENGEALGPHKSFFGSFLFRPFACVLSMMGYKPGKDGGGGEEECSYEELPTGLRRRWREYTSRFNGNLNTGVDGEMLCAIRKKVWQGLVGTRGGIPGARPALPPALPPSRPPPAKPTATDSDSMEGGKARMIRSRSLGGAMLRGGRDGGRDGGREGGRGGEWSAPGSVRVRGHAKDAPTSQNPLDFQPFAPRPPTERGPAKTEEAARLAKEKALRLPPSSSPPSISADFSLPRPHDPGHTSRPALPQFTPPPPSLPPSLPPCSHTLTEARLRLYTVLKHVYSSSFYSGLLSPRGLRAFEHNISTLLMDTSVPLNEWAGLEHHILFPLRAVRAQARLRRLPLVGRAVQYLLGKKLAFFFELAVVFIQSHSNAHKKLNELFGKNGPVTRQLEKEVEEEVSKAKAALEEFVPVFPDIINSVKTEMATRYMLNKCRSMLEAAMESGSLEKREFEDAIREVSALPFECLNSKDGGNR